MRIIHNKTTSRINCVCGTLFEFDVGDIKSRTQEQMVRTAWEEGKTVHVTKLWVECPGCGDPFPVDRGTRMGRAWEIRKEKERDREGDEEVD